MCKLICLYNRYMFVISFNSILATLQISLIVHPMANTSRTIIATVVFALLVAYPTNADELASHQEKVNNKSQLTILQPRSKHFVLVHGGCHGAWSWYKLIPLLQKAGHNVTSIDLGASGRRPENLTDLNGFPDYVKPLVDVMEGLSASEKVILVGHSFGGLPIAWATELYREKILVGVYLAAFMPDTVSKAFNPIQQYFASLPPGYYVDSEINNNFPVPRLNFTLLFGPIDLRTKGYQKSPDEDLALALTLVRATSLFQQDLSNTTFTRAKYGAVPRIYVVSTNDLLLRTSYQRVMIQNFPPREVKMIHADHFSMASAPLRLFSHLSDIANRY